MSSRRRSAVSLIKCHVARQLDLMGGLRKRKSLLPIFALLILELVVSRVAVAQTLDIGDSADFFNAIQTVGANPANDYTLNFLSGFTMSQQSLDISSDSTIKFAGNSKTLDGANLYQPLILTKGTVELQSLKIINTSQPVTVNGGTLIDKTGSLNGAVVNNSIVAFDSPNPLTYGGNMSGNGGVQILGLGPVTFSGTNSYSGGTYIAGGATLIGTTNSLQGNFTNFGKLEFHQATSGTYAGVIQGIGAVVISGSGPIRFTGLNNYIGGTYVNSGSQLIGTTGSLRGQIFNSGVVQFDQAAGGTFSGKLSGTGSVQISGSGPITFSAANTHTGGTFIDAGSKLIGTSVSLQGSIENDGTLEFDQLATGAFAGNISGLGGVLISGSGPVVFTGLNSYTGGTTVESGSTLMGNAKSLQGDINNQGAVQFISGGNGTYSGDMSGSGRLTIGSSAAITLLGQNSYSGGTTVDEGGILIGTTSSLQGTITNQGLVRFNSLPSSFQLQHISLPPGSPPTSIPIFRVSPGYVPPASNVFGGAISGVGQVEIAGSGITGFTGQNTYTGGTTVKSGSALTGSTTSLQGNIINHGFVQFKNTTASEGGVMLNGPLPTGTYAGNLSGTGGVEISGAAPIRFSGTNTYTGGAYIDHGSSLIGTTANLQGQIANDGQVTFDQNFAGVYSGNLSGFGGVLIKGEGPVTFSGNNSYIGGTEINSGSTLIGTTSSLKGQIFNDGLVRFHQNVVGTFAGAISGSGEVEIAGLGPVVLASLNTYTGTTTVTDASTLVVNGSLVGHVDVENNARLMGFGAVGSATIEAGGTIAPGTIGDPLRIHGDFIQRAGSSYTAGLNNTGSDRIVVDGTAQIGTGTKLNLGLGSEPLTVGKSYELLSATEGIEGQYANIFTSQTNQLVAFAPQYTSNKLSIAVNSNLSPYANSANQKTVATVIDYSSQRATGDYANVITHLTTLHPGQVMNALDQLSGDVYPTFSTIERQTSTVQMQLLSNRLARLKGPGLPNSGMVQTTQPIRLVSSQATAVEQGVNPTTTLPPASRMWSTWAQGYGLGGSISGDQSAGGANYRLGGTLFGVERWVAEPLLIGLLGGYAGTSVDQGLNDSTGQINAYQIGLYELFRQEEYYLSNVDYYGNNNYDVSRPLRLGDIHKTASSSSQGNQWSHYTEGGINLDFEEFRIQPFMGFQYIYINQQGFHESGAGSLNLNTGGLTVSSLRNSFGARVYDERMWGSVLVIPSFAASYQHEWGDGTQVVSSSFAGAPTVQFATLGNSTGRDFGLLSLNGTAYFTDRLSLYAAVDTQFAARYSAVIGSGGVQYSW